jgi:hypothetical protein
VLDLINANHNRFISRPVVEAPWAWLCRELADLKFPAHLNFALAGPREALLYEAYSQVLFSKVFSGWDTNFYVQIETQRELECGGFLGKNV